MLHTSDALLMLLTMEGILGKNIVRTVFVSISYSENSVDHISVVHFIPFDI